MDHWSLRRHFGRYKWNPQHTLQLGELTGMSCFFLILLSGCIFLFSSSCALYRFRIGQTVSASSAEREKMRRPKFFGAQTFLQFSVTYQFTVFLVLFLSIFCRSFVLISVIGVLVMVGMTIYYEFNIVKIKKEADRFST